MSNTETTRIARVVETYLEGARTGSTATLRPIFHDLATICGYVGPDLFAGPIQMFYDWHEENGPADSVRADPPRIDIEGTAASVRLELYDWTGHRFTDFLNLVKIEDRWQIVGKIFYLHPEP